MKVNYIIFSIWMLVLVALQVLVFNHIHLFFFATPYIYFFPILTLPTSVSRNRLLWIGFIVGLLVDIFSNTLGMNAASTVLIAFLRPSILKLSSPRDLNEEYTPHADTMGRASYWKYVGMMLVIHHATFLTLLYFSFMHLGDLSIHIFSSVILSLFLYFIYNRLRERT